MLKQGSLQNTQLFYNPKYQKMKIKKIKYKKKIIKNVEKAGFWAIGGILRPKLKRVIIFFSKK